MSIIQFFIDLANIRKVNQVKLQWYNKHWSLNTINKYEFARLIDKQFKLKTIVQKSIYSIYSKRMLNSSMDLDKLKKLIQIKIFQQLNNN